jgi:parvulin-like peptidyl-prolyl isomerase
VGRSKKAAKSLAKQIREQLIQGEDMALLARRHSNDPTAARGGFLGASERGAWVPAFEDAAFALDVGEISRLVETNYGFHILRREALQEVKLMHLLVAHQDAKNVARARSIIGKRSKEEALQIAEQAHEALQSGVLFATVAGELSDGPMALRGADLGWFVRGELGPAFDEAAFSLEVGHHSDIFETVFGYHLIQRLE